MATYTRPSAKTGKGCKMLRDALGQAIGWRSIPEITSPAVHHRFKREMLSLRGSDLVLSRLPGHPTRASA